MIIKVTRGWKMRCSNSLFEWAEAVRFRHRATCAKFSTYEEWVEVRSSPKWVGHPGGYIRYRHAGAAEQFANSLRERELKLDSGFICLPAPTYPSLMVRSLGSLPRLPLR